jgi:hypothetical protein
MARCRAAATRAATPTALTQHTALTRPPMTQAGSVSPLLPHQGSTWGWMRAAPSRCGGTCTGGASREEEGAVGGEGSVQPPTEDSMQPPRWALQWIRIRHMSITTAVQGGPEVSLRPHHCVRTAMQACCKGRSSVMGLSVLNSVLRPCSCRPQLRQRRGGQTRVGGDSLYRRDATRHTKKAKSDSSAFVILSGCFASSCGRAAPSTGGQLAFAQPPP